MSKSFVVKIEKLTFDTIIGILEFERNTPQQIVIDISFTYQYSNDSKEFIDYAKVANLVKTTMIEKKFELIEEAIVYLENQLLKTYPISNLSIKIAKPDILDDCVVSVSLEVL